MQNLTTSMETQRRTIFPISYYQGQVEDNERLKQDLLPFIESTQKTLTPPEGLSLIHI
mgnify:CR=1 FL=1